MLTDNNAFPISPFPERDILPYQLIARHFAVFRHVSLGNRFACWKPPQRTAYLFNARTFYKLSSVEKGTIGELKAAQLLTDDGYEVYRNMAATGKADLLVVRGNLAWLLDVKASKHAGHKTRLSERQEWLGVQPYMVQL